MDGLFIAKESITAPLKLWRLILRAIVPTLPFVALAIIVRFPFDRATDYDDLHPARLAAQAPLWIAIGLFEWNWLGLLRAPQSSWRDRLRGQSFALMAFATLSWALLSTSKLLEPLQSFIQSYDPIVNQVGDRIYYATSFKTLGLCLLLWLALSWLRLRLLLWPIDIFANGRPTSPAATWRMTKGQLRELLFMVFAIGVSIGAIGGLAVGVVHVFVGKVSYVIALPVLLWYFAALDHAYLKCHQALQSGRRITSPQAAQ
ncbi:MAG: hypothetical protein HYU58_02075 [Proteobacteria bacterium]|nr:hypothetical protein [Pseudomonadota bacterium]